MSCCLLAVRISTTKTPGGWYEEGGHQHKQPGESRRWSRQLETERSEEHQKRRKETNHTTSLDEVPNKTSSRSPAFTCSKCGCDRHAKVGLSSHTRQCTTTTQTVVLRDIGTPTDYDWLPVRTRHVITRQPKTYHITRPHSFSTRHPLLANEVVPRSALLATARRHLEPISSHASLHTNYKN